MKKSILCAGIALACAASAFAAPAAAAKPAAAKADQAEQFSPRLINLYLAPKDAKTSAKPAGKLLPTNAFSAKCSGEICELTIKGRYNPAKGPALYYADHNRILVAAFAKKSPAKFIPLSKPNAAGFADASVVAYAKKSELAGAVNSVQPLYAKAREMFAENCGTCHALHPEGEFSANQWPGNFKAMQSRTAIEKEDVWLVTQYLQKHAKDMKETK